MKVLFISRKNSHHVGGLSRFVSELTTHFPAPYQLMSPTSLTLPTFGISHIHLLDATLLLLGVLLKFILRKPLTLTAHGLDLTYQNPLYQLMLKVLLPKIDAIILDSHVAKSLLSKFNIPKHKIFIIPPGISINHFKPPNLKNETKSLSRFARNKLVLLTVGNLVPRKGHFWFVTQVLPKLSEDFIYLIVGDGPEKESLELRVQNSELQERVFLLGRLTDQQLTFVFQKTDIYVCPNQKIPGNFEGFGLAVGEAAAMGIPVVASNVDGISEIIKHNQNGWLVKPMADQFITAINQLKDPKLRRKIGQKAKIYTKDNYNWQKTAKKYLDLFEELIDKT